jgi:S1-C subfamily serine protease
VPFLGIDVEELDGDMSEKLGVKQGVLISRINGTNPDSKKKLLAGDIIVKIDGLEVISKSFYDEQLAYHRPGDVVKLEVKRDKELKTINIQLVNNQGTTEMIKRISYKSESLGAEFELVSKLERERYDIEFGVKVSNITSGKIRSMNIEEGFIFTSINQKEFSDLKSFVSYLEEITGQVKVEGVSPSGVRRYMSFYIR